MLRKAVLLVVAVACLGTGPAPSTYNYDDLAAKFFDLLAEGKADAAIDSLYKTNPYSDKITDAIQKVKSGLASMTGLIGTYRGSSLIIRKELGDRIAYLYYIAAYDREPIKFEFFFYKPSDKWLLQSMSFDDKVLDDVREFARYDLTQKLK
jgi:hypothetical protein